MLIQISEHSNNKYENIDFLTKLRIHHLGARLSKVKFDLRQYGMDPISFNELFDTYVSTGKEYGGVFHRSYLVGFNVSPKGYHAFSIFMQRLRKPEGERLACRWPLDCYDFVAMVEYLADFIMCVVPYFCKRDQISSIPADIEIGLAWCVATHQHEFHIRICPAHVQTLMRIAHDDANDEDMVNSLPVYENFLIESLAENAFKQGCNISSYYPVAYVVPFLTWYRQYRKVCEYYENNKKYMSIISMITKAVAKIRCHGKISTNAAAVPMK